jgi:hypothetical protein
MVMPVILKHMYILSSYHSVNIIVTLKDGIDTLSRNVGNYQSTPRNIPEKNYLKITNHVTLKLMCLKHALFLDITRSLILNNYHFFQGHSP